MKIASIALTIVSLLASPLALAKTVDAVASFTVLADMIKEVGGDHVQVKSLVGPNGDPHTFEPTPQDSRSLAKADLVFVNGLGMEGWMDRLISASGYQRPVVVTSVGIEKRQMEEDGHIEDDPHAWNSMYNGAVYAKNIMNALITADPDDADVFRQRGAAYIARLNELDQWAKGVFAAIPQQKRKVLTSHDALGYFGQRYQVTFLAPVGLSTDAEASASDIAALITQLKTEKIHTYFIENQTDPRLVNQIAREAGAHSGGELYPEALSEHDGPAATYEAAFKHNVDVIAASMK